MEHERVAHPVAVCSFGFGNGRGYSSGSRMNSPAAIRPAVKGGKIKHGIRQPSVAEVQLFIMLWQMRSLHFMSNVHIV